MKRKGVERKKRKMENDKDIFVEQNTVGLIMKYYREKYGLKQSDICEGICSRQVVARLESGVREVDSLTCETLLSRIGQEVNQFEIMLDDKDYENWILRNKLLNQINTEKYENFEDALGLYQKQMDKENKLQYQFYLYCRIKYKLSRKESQESILEDVEKALFYTGQTETKRKLYSKIELKLSLIKISMLRQLDRISAEEAEHELFMLLKYVKKYYAKKQRQKLEQIILEELVNVWKKVNRYEKALGYLDELIQVTREQNNLFPLGKYFFTKVQFQEKLYGAQIPKEEYVEECKMAYYIYRMWEKNKEAEEVKKYCEEKLKCLIINQEW